MIKLRYNAIPQPYLDFVDKFKKKLKKWLDNKYIGAVGKGVNLCAECEEFFYNLTTGNNLRDFLLADASEHRRIIEKLEDKYPQLAKDRTLSPNDKVTPRSDLYQCLYKAFVNLGYCDSDFPNFELTNSLKLEACPYCNAEGIISQEITCEDGTIGKIKNSELDHFYPKSRIPYLAISLYNLVPSGSICNGAYGKHDDDTYSLKLVNPFSLNDSNGIMFEIDSLYAGVLDYRNFISNCKIYTLTPDSNLVPNCTTFELRGRYEKELEKAKRVWMLNRKVVSKGYTNLIADKEREVGVKLTYEEWLDDELDIDCIHYTKKLSKFCWDIWQQLQRTRL